MRITFLHAPIPLRTVDNRASYWHHFDVRYKAVHLNVRPMRKVLFELPQWIPWLAGVLRAEGFEQLSAVEFYTDCTLLNGMDEDRIHSMLVDHPADVYLLSPMTINLPQALRIAELAKDAHPKVITVMGGVVATPLHKQVARHPSVDYVVRDRGEYALPELLRALRDRRHLEHIGNLTYVTADGRLTVVPWLYPAMPVEYIPFPQVDIFPQETGRDLRYIRQNYALGCPFTCDFCTIQTIGRKPSYFPIPRVMAEIEAYRRHYGSHHHVYFGDETFTLRPNLTLRLCAALRDYGNITFDCQTRLNCLREEYLSDALSMGGCRWMEIGLESANQHTQEALKQHTRLSMVEQVLARLRDAGIPTCSYLIIGLPNETVNEMRHSVDYVSSLIDKGLLYASYISVFVPYPGTSMFADPQQYGMRLHHRAFDLYNEELPPVFDSPHASADAVYRVFLDGVGQLAEAMAATPTLTGTLPMAISNAGSTYGEFYRGG